MTRLYLETNFLMSCATGRDSTSTLLLEECPMDIQRVLPSFCLMEALATLEDRQRRHNRSIDTYRREANEAERNQDLPSSPELGVHLRQASFHAITAFDAFRSRLFQSIERMTDGSSVQLLQANAGRYLSGFTLNETIDPTDQLILTTILDESPIHPTARKAFLSENRNCFDKPAIKQALIDSGIRYFASAANFLQWHDAQTET